MKKIGKPDYFKQPKFDNLDEELAFLLWSSELNKEILAFWKSMIKN